MPSLRKRIYAYYWSTHIYSVYDNNLKMYPKLVPYFIQAFTTKHKYTANEELGSSSEDKLSI